MKLPKSKRERIHYMTPGPERQRERSKTYSGIAQAMAAQWSAVDEYIPEQLELIMEISSAIGSALE